MQVFLAIHSKQKAFTDSFLIEEKADAMVAHYQQFVKNQLNKLLHVKKGVALIYITDKPLGSDSYFLQESENSIYFSTGTPTGLSKLFSDYDMSQEEERCLINLKSLFDRHGLRLLEKISPPFIFGFIENDNLEIVHDGLGFEQGFVYENDDFWMCSNKCYPIISFSADKFDINTDGWRHYFQRGWFHHDHTPFKEIKALGMGESWVCRDGEVQKKQLDCFNQWLKPVNMNTPDVLEFLRESFNATVQELVIRYCKKHVMADLSGGRDTRMILSSLIYNNIDCQFNTVGEQFSADVGAVKKIQAYYPIDVQYINPNLKQSSKNITEEKIRRMILWQDGFGEMKSAKYFSLVPQVVPPSSKFTGLMGGFYKATSYPKTAFNQTPKQRIKGFINTIRGKKRRTERDIDYYLEIKKQALQEARRYALKGYYRYDYYGFIERGRRWSSACAANPLSGTLLPFLDFNLIRSSFSIPEKDKMSHKIHDYVIQKNAHKLSEFPYEKDIFSKNKLESKSPFNENLFWQLDASISIMDNIVNKDHYMWEILDQTATQSIWEEHKSGNLKMGNYLWKIAGFYYWHERFQRFLK